METTETNKVTLALELRVKKVEVKRDFTNARRTLVTELNSDDQDPVRILSALDLLSQCADAAIDVVQKLFCESQDAKQLEEMDCLEEEYNKAVSRAGDTLERLQYSRPSRAATGTHTPASVSRARAIADLRQKLAERDVSWNVRVGDKNTCSADGGTGSSDDEEGGSDVPVNNLSLVNQPAPCVEHSSAIFSPVAMATAVAPQSAIKTEFSSDPASIGSNNYTTVTDSYGVTCSSYSLPATSVAMATISGAPPMATSAVSNRVARLNAGVSAFVPRRTVKQHTSAAVLKQDTYQQSLPPLPQQQSLYPNNSGTCNVSQPQQYALQTTQQQQYPVSRPQAMPVMQPRPPAPLVPTVGAAPPDVYKHLKKVKIPEYNGDKSTYATWKAAFSVCVDEQPLSPQLKLLQLRQCLTGAALKCIESYGYSAAAYSAAMRRLEQKFGGERRQTAVHTEALSRLPVIREDRAAKELEKFADLLQIAVIHLDDAGCVQELEAGAFYQQLLRKLPQSMLARYYRQTKEHGFTESVRTLLDWVVAESDYLARADETANGITAPSQKSKATEPRRVHLSSRESATPGTSKVQCPCCPEQHQVWQCPVFRGKTVDERWSLAKQNSLCYRCLGRGHMGKDCQRLRKCGVERCTDTHNWLLHRSQSTAEKKEQQPDNTSTSAQSAAEKQEQQPDKTSTSNTVNRAHNVSHVSVKPPGALRTVPVDISHGQRRVRINALLDDGSTQTLISDSAARELGLRGKTHPVTVYTLNGHSETFSSMQVAFQLTSTDGDTIVDIVADTVPAVSKSLKPVSWSHAKSNWQHLSGIPFVE